MPLTPLDIHNKEFGRRLRGYDEDEVNEFLDQIIKDYEALIRENKELQNQALNLQEKLNHFSNIEETLSKTIIVAQEAADEVKNNSKKEAQLIIKEAEKNADRIINEALSKSRKVAMEVEELKKQASIYRMRFRSLVEAQLELLSQDGWESLEGGSLLQRESREGREQRDGGENRLSRERETREMREALERE
ncbi:septum formation initiator [Paenibacillus darwinianus]|uniref:Septum formation initiator n=1 Tax=Paenibacillus darwinianus TaxID=1380763 RepID=A0A9W5S2V4_9BACL|nr:DivIVA domain-containing protein [Paenibacillus darwinianus]EXX91707.1 septum formation initiator [Paenibacillus darwinianus]EXX92577.1 septum formation initiator [Paenibacillus darwinianus]EXX92699.1 septum formation initiator [Paenibacillus darwinianus]